MTMPRYMPALLALGLFDESAWGSRACTVEPRARPKCGLPVCDKPANRGGYCSAEHCREHKELDRKARRNA